MHLEVLQEEGKKIFNKLSTFENFYLAGGTALALLIGHRISVDFDLFTNEEIPRNLLDKVKRIYPNNKLSPSVNSKEELTVFIKNTNYEIIQ
jgi:hypothetical protein